MDILAAFLIGTLFLDALVRPRQSGFPALRSAAGLWLLWLMTAIPFGAIWAMTGNSWLALALTLALTALFTAASNSKYAMLGEALVFSDLALIGAIFRHPQFYMSALSRTQKAALLIAVPIVPFLLWWFHRPDTAEQIGGAMVALASMFLIALSLRLPPWSQLALTPDSDVDMRRHGLLPMLLVYWLRWRASVDAAPPVTASASEPADPHTLAVIVQCESFADPVDLFGENVSPLPGLAAARAQAWQWGRLMVGGFGAYTMRTEYGVLFGRDEQALGFRRYDPFLTAARDRGFGLPARLAVFGWRGMFLHPHDLRFYNRDVVMQVCGFAELVGPPDFAHPAPGEGRYVTDAAVADRIVALARNAARPTLIYAVTIENHGPWEADDADPDLMQGYLRLVRKGDAMLSRLSADIAALARPATLVFFGDHRPSIPGVTAPGGPRHTPYVILRFNEQGQLVAGSSTPIDLTPAQLHHLLLTLWTQNKNQFALSDHVQPFTT